MKSATLPSIRVEPELRTAVESLLHEGESLSQFLENAVRDALNTLAARRLAVLRPVKVVLTNLAADEVLECRATDNPQDENPTTRPVALTREVKLAVAAVVAGH